MFILHKKRLVRTAVVAFSGDSFIVLSFACIVQERSKSRVGAQINLAVVVDLAHNLDCLSFELTAVNNTYEYRARVT